MLEDMSKDALFYNYYTQWIEVYKKDAIREATMAKYRMTQKWVEKLAPELKVCELTRTAYQKILNDYAKEHERQTTLDFHHQLVLRRNMYLEGLKLITCLWEKEKIVL